MQKHTIFGAGLIGGFLGGVLSSLGLETTLVCRPSIKKKLEKGLLLTDYLGNKATAKQLHLVNNDPLVVETFENQPCDFLWITVKCTAMEQASGLRKKLAAVNILQFLSFVEPFELPF